MQARATNGDVASGTGGERKDRFGAAHHHFVRSFMFESRNSAEQLTPKPPYADLHRRYDGPETLFYLDPPYWGCEEDYGAGTFGRGDFQQLSDIVGNLAGRFVLSINATDGAREVFGRFAVEEVETTYTISTASGGSGQRVKELIVTA